MLKDGYDSVLVFDCIVHITLYKRAFLLNINPVPVETMNEDKIKLHTKDLLGLFFKTKLVWTLKIL